MKKRIKPIIDKSWEKRKVFNNIKLSNQDALLKKWIFFFIKIKLFNFLVIKGRFEDIFSLGVHEKNRWNLFVTNFLKEKSELKKVFVLSLYKKHFPTMKRGLFYEYLINRYFIIDSKRREYARLNEGSDSGFFETLEKDKSNQVNSVLVPFLSKCFRMITSLYRETLYLPNRKLKWFHRRVKDYVLYKTLGSNISIISKILRNEDKYKYPRKVDKKLSYFIAYLFFYRYVFFIFYKKLRKERLRYFRTIPFIDASDYNKFSWNGRLGNLYLRCRYSNVFFTVADVKGNVLYTITPSQISDKNNKKYKLSVHLTEKIVKFKLLPICKKYGINRLTMVLLGKAAKHAKSVEYFCRKSKVYFNDWVWEEKIPHHKGRKMKKKRRL